MNNLLLIVVGSVLVNNFVMSQFLGICPFLGVSKKSETALGMGLAVTFVMTIASFFTYIIENYLLIPLHLEFMQTIAFILVIAALIRNFLQYAGVQAFLSGVRPCVVAMILATAVTMGLKSLVQFQRWGDSFAPDWKSLTIFVLLWAVHLFWKKTRKKAPSPMAMIGLSALMGILFFGLA